MHFEPSLATLPQRQLPLINQNDTMQISNNLRLGPLDGLTTKLQSCGIVAGAQQDRSTQDKSPSALGLSDMGSDNSKTNDWKPGTVDMRQRPKERKSSTIQKRPRNARRAATPKQMGSTHVTNSSAPEERFTHLLLNIKHAGFENIDASKSLGKSPPRSPTELTG